MTDYVDLERIRDLEGVMGTDAVAIVSSMLEEMTGAIGEVESALPTGDLERVTRAAHRCRNDALMLGAQQLLRALTDLEAATRDDDRPRATAALERVRVAWPPTRAELLVATASRP
jgi:HPt (histidine-containing phosphotransfer) domain-containing protein